MSYATFNYTSCTVNAVESKARTFVIKAFWVVCLSQNSGLASIVLFKIRIALTVSVSMTKMFCADVSWFGEEEEGKELVGLGDTFFLCLQYQ